MGWARKENSIQKNKAKEQKRIWGVDNRKGHNYQNNDFELTQLLYAIHRGD